MNENGWTTEMETPKSEQKLRLVFWPSRCTEGCEQPEPLHVSFCPHGCLYDQMRTEYIAIPTKQDCSICNNPKCDSPCGKH